MPRPWKSICICLLFVCILLTGYWIRVHGHDRLPQNQFTGNDAYFYYWQASIISEQGKLPPRDMHRWLPLGRDLEQTLNIYGYLLAYAHKIIRLLTPNVSLYQITIYAPVVCFILGLGILCLFLYRCFGLVFSGCVGVILATLPSAVERSAVGFGDRDSWCFLIAILAITAYLVSLKSSDTKQRWLFTISSSISVYVGGLSWEGFGVFVIIILCVELWRFLTTDTEQDILYYLVWVAPFAITLYASSPAYHSGYGFSKHVTALLITPSCVLLLMKGVRYLLITHLPFALHARKISFILSGVAVISAVGYIFLQLDTLDSTTVALSQNTLMTSVSELRNPTFKYWTDRYGSIFILGSIAIIIGIIITWKKEAAFWACTVACFAITAFFREPLDTLWGTHTTTLLFYLSIVGYILGYLWIASKQKTPAQNDIEMIAFLTWFIFWAALSRDAKRYDFFLGMPLAYFTAYGIHALATALTHAIRHPEYTTDKLRQLLPQTRLKSAGTILLLLLILFWTPYPQTRYTLNAATTMRKAKPGRSRVTEMFLWIKMLYLKTHKNPDAVVVAAHWGYGSQLNVLAGVKTIIDQDHYIQHWIHLYKKHVYNASSEREVLEFLKTHEVSHLILGPKDPKETFLHRELSDAFIPVYPINNFHNATIKLWKLQYPAEIEKNPVYLETKFQ